MSRFHLVLGILVSAAITSTFSLDPVKIAWKPKLGDSHYYKVEMTVTAPAESSDDVKISAELKQTVQAIAKDGTVSVDRHWSKFKAVVSGSDSDDQGKPADSTTRVTFSSNGDVLNEVPLNDDGTPKVIKKSTNPEDDADDTGDEANFELPIPPVIFPKDPVEVGGTWVEEDPDKDDKPGKDGKKPPKKKPDEKKDPTGDPFGGNIFFKYVGDETVASKDCYRIDVDTKPGKDSDPTAYGHFWISKEDGSLIQLEVKIKGIQGPEKSVINMDITANLDD